MSYDEKRTELATELKQRQDTIKVIAQLQNIDNVTSEADVAIDAIINVGTFDTIDADIKTPVLAARTALKTLRTAYNDIAIREALDWRP